MNKTRDNNVDVSRIYSYEHCLDDFITLLNSKFPNRTILFFSDEHTEQAAGIRLKALCNQAKFPYEEFILETDETIISAEYKHVSLLKERIERSSAVPVAVGSGTINDLVKCASDQADVPYICVATATSVDGYCATGAALVKNGLKMTVPCAAPMIVFGDPEVMISAPYDMTSAGYGDLYAKIPAGADWILADALGVEKIDSESWNIVQSHLPEYLANPENLKHKKPASFGRLFKGLCEVGIAMQLYGNSRPASGAEHLISHVWEMEHLTHHGVVVSHGFKVSIGTIILTMIMEKFFTLPVDQYDIDEIITGRETWEERTKVIRSCFPEKNIQNQILATCRNKWIDDETLFKRLVLLKEHWIDITHAMQAQIVNSRQLLHDLGKAGCPTRLSEIGCSKNQIRSVLVKAQMIRDRFTILDCLYELGILSEMIDYIEASME